jgi:hypothetical protein
MDVSNFWWQSAIQEDDNCLSATISAANNNTATNENVTLDDLFTQEQIESGDCLTVNIESGAVVGSTVVGTAAFNVSTAFALAGAVRVNNEGTIIGIGGAGSTVSGGVGSNGGDAFTTTVDVTLNNSGTISGGGGGGGSGGQGGSGTETQEVTLGKGPCAKNCNTSCQNGFGAGAFCPSDRCNTGSGCTQFYCSRCKKSETVTTVGGDGGNGGNGAGYNQAATNGVAGAVGGGTSGNGGTGGDGGAVAAAGADGTAGANGASTNGLPGGVGGQPGAATVSNGNTITLINNGTINGAQL